MKISILAETVDFDLRSYQTLVRKIFKDCFLFSEIAFPEPIDRLFIGNKGSLVKRLDQKIDILAENTIDLELIFVLVDCDSLTPAEQRREINKKLKLIQHFSPHKVIIGLPKRNIEAWLISDITKVLNLKNKEIPDFVKVEEIKDPKAIFKTIRKKFYSDVKPTLFAQDIINKTDIKNIISKSTTFILFLKEIKSKVSELKISINPEIKKLINSVR